MYLKNYIIAVIIMFIGGYFSQRIYIARRPYRDYEGTRERPPRLWGPFSKGEIIGWIVRSFMVPMVFLFTRSNLIPEKALNIVYGVHVLLWLFLVPIIIETIIDGK